MKSEVPDFYISFVAQYSTSNIVSLPGYIGQMIRLVYAAIGVEQSGVPVATPPGRVSLRIVCFPPAGNGEQCVNVIQATLSDPAASQQGLYLIVMDDAPFEGDLQIQPGASGELFFTNVWPVGLDPTSVPDGSSVSVLLGFKLSNPTQ